MFSHGISPLKDMLVNLNMVNVMIWPRYAVSFVQQIWLLTRWGAGTTKASR